MHDAPPPGRQKAPPWLIIFGDLAALLLTFFVMIFAMSEVPSERWEAMVGTMSTSFEANLRNEPSEPHARQNIATVELDQALPASYLGGVLSEMLARDAVLKDALLLPREDRLVVSLPGDVLFGAGEAVIDEQARLALFRLGGVIAQLANQVEVRGHADPTTADGGDFAEAWSLSLARAMAVAEELADSGYGRDIVVLGLGDSRYRHISTTLPEARRRALSRRVDVVIHQNAVER